MKILMLLENNFPPDTRVENEINALIEAGHEIHLACTKTKRNQSEKNFCKTVIHRIELTELQRKSSVGALVFPLYFNVWRKYVKKLFEQYHFDAIHVHDLQLAIIGHEMKKKFGAKFVLDLHENWPALLNISGHTKSFLGKILFSLGKWKRYERIYVNLADEIIVVVEESKDRIVDLGADPKKIHIVSNTLNLEEFDFEIEPKTNSKTIFSYAGGVTYHRGLQYVVEAVSKVKNDNFEVWIVGNGAYLSTLEEQTKNLGVEDNVRFFGWQDRNKLLKIVSESDVALIPHIKSDHTDSTIPHKLFQYMFAEKPILASNCSPIERIINETSSGIIYPFNDVAELAKKIDEINYGKIILKDFAKGKPFVENKYNWEVDKMNLLEVYSS